jgi:hypothetical protein
MQILYKEFSFSQKKGHSILLLEGAISVIDAGCTSCTEQVCVNCRAFSVKCDGTYTNR